MKKEISVENPIHIIKASWMNKAELLELIIGKEEWQHFNTKIPFEHQEDFHSPTHVYDVRNKTCINLLELGIKKGLIYKTI